MITDVLYDVINHFVFVYLDNIFIFSQSPQEHEEHVRQVYCASWQISFMSKWKSVSSTCLLYVIAQGKVWMD